MPSETPAKLTPTNDGFDHERRDVMIPMRDGVKLHTVVLVPKGSRRAPMLLTRTPYDANALTTHAASAHLGPALHGYDNALDVIIGGGYIRVVQDVRGKYGSEGDYVMNRPLHGPQNPTPVDHATDTYDTIDWLVKNVPESNGNVGILGISYDGFLPLMALVNPHPALKVSVPMNPMVDGWMGDDWFHNGAFRQQNMPYIYEQVVTRDNSAKWWSTHWDDYDMFMQAGSAGELGRRRGLEQSDSGARSSRIRRYDAFWQDQAMDRVLARAAADGSGHARAQPVGSGRHLRRHRRVQGDQTQGHEQRQSVSRARTVASRARDRRRQLARRRSTSRATHRARFSATCSLPFLDHYLKDGAPQADVSPVTAFETGTNTWRHLTSWPSGCTAGCTTKPTPLYLQAGFGLGFTAPVGGGAAFDEYVSDPAKPVPYRARPTLPTGYDEIHTWPRWLVDDQREASGRTDVLAFTSSVLTEPVKISGQAVANIIASTSGTDADWVVKLIDVYPDEFATQPELGGYQLMIAGDIFRGRYRESFETPKAIEANKPLTYKFALPTANHVFLPGHRIMVQIQSSWFPLYDRNPQTFVPSIFWAKPEDYRKATQRIFHAPGQASFVELPIVTAR